MRNKYIPVSCGIIVMLLALALAPIQPANAQFVIAYDYDESNNGNYVAYIMAYYDSVFNDTMYHNPVSYPNATNALALPVDVGVNITLAVFCWVNGTLTGISSLSEGLDIMRHNISVMAKNGTVIFSQQNFTYITGADFAPMWFFRHDIILDFVPVSDEYYTATITFEVYY